MTGREAFCVQLGLDSAELRDYRYHYGRTNIPVWAIDDAYFCVTGENGKPAKYQGDAKYWDWKEHSRYNGFIIW